MTTAPEVREVIPLYAKVKSMERAHHRRLIEQLRAEPGSTSEPGRAVRPAFRVAAERYRSAAHCERERARLFGGLRGGTWVGPPRAIAGSASIAARLGQVS